MKIEGSETLPGTPEQVWDLMLDPDILASAMPGCKELRRVGEDEYEGIIEAKIGPVSSQYTTKFKITDKHPPHSYHLQMEGKGKGGFVSGGAQIRLEQADANETIMRYEGDAKVGGTIARVGQRLVESAAKMLIKKGFGDLKDKVEARVNG